MHLEVTHHVDASEPDAQGGRAWRYEYDLFRFFDEEVAYVARSYATAPEEAHFLRSERLGKSIALARKDLAHPLFRRAVQHLRTTGKREINWLSRSGYVALASDL